MTIINCERLNKLEAETLKMRRSKLDLVMYYNILHGFVDSDAGSLFDTINCNVIHNRGHPLRIIKQHCNVNCRSSSFVCRNSLWSQSSVMYNYFFKKDSHWKLQFSNFQTLKKAQNLRKTTLPIMRRLAIRACDWLPWHDGRRTDYRRTPRS